MTFITYILQSERDESYYIRSTDNLERRLAEHNKGKSKYTKARTPWSVVYKEEFTSLSESRKREFYLKSLKSKIAILKLINKALSSSG